MWQKPKKSKVQNANVPPSLCKYACSFRKLYTAQQPLINPSFVKSAIMHHNLFPNDSKNGET